jgi:hypothetical protein
LIGWFLDAFICMQIWELNMLRLSRKIALVVSFAAFASGVSAESSHKVLVLGPPGVATPQPNTLLIAAPLANVSKHAVTKVKVTHIELGKALLQSSLPVLAGDIPAGGNVVVQAQFDSSGLKSGRTYEFELRGVYRGRDRDDDYDHDDRDRQGGKDDKKDERMFKVHASVTIPPPPQGPGALGTVTVPSQTVTGGKYPPQPPQQDEDVNSGAPTVPTNPEVPGAPPPKGTEVKPPQ